MPCPIREADAFDMGLLEGDEAEEAADEENLKQADDAEELAQSQGSQRAGKRKPLAGSKLAVFVAIIEFAVAWGPHSNLIFDVLVGRSVSGRHMLFAVVHPLNLGRVGLICYIAASEAWSRNSISGITSPPRCSKEAGKDRLSQVEGACSQDEEGDVQQQSGAT